MGQPQTPVGEAGLYITLNLIVAIDFSGLFVCFTFMNCRHRHLFYHLDVTTRGPALFTVSLGKHFPGCKKQTVVDFELV